MTEVLRPSMYGALHPIEIISQNTKKESDLGQVSEYLVVGHCCESGDVWTCANGDPE